MSKLRKLFIYICASVSVTSYVACDKPGEAYVLPPYTVPTFTNPVTGPSLLNPSVLRTWDGWFYAYGSEENWVGSGGNRLMPVLKSSDLINWTYERNVFSTRPTWRTGTLSSPEVIEINKRPHIYYTFGNATDINVSIGVGISFNPAGAFSDREDFEEMGDKPSNLLDIDSTNIADPRHPFYYDDSPNKTKYLFWNSANAGEDAAVYCIKLTDNGLRITDFTTFKKIASRALEGITIHKRANHFYLFGTKVNGSSSTIVVGRATNLLGPYVDKSGKDLLDLSAGTVFVEEGEVFRSPGHTTRIFTDKDNSDWIMFHAVDKRDPTFSNNVEKKPLILVKVNWNNEWPEPVAEYLTDEKLIGPNFY